MLAGLTNGSVYNQISLPHTPKKSTTSYTGTTVEYPENRPAMQGSALFLYATDEYTNLKGFTVDQIEITAGETTYTVGEDGITTDENHTYTDENHTYKVTVNDQWTTENERHEVPISRRKGGIRRGRRDHPKDRPQKRRRDLQPDHPVHYCFQ